MKTQDRLGRWLFTSHTTRPIENFRPDARQLRWMQFLNLHGLASSKYLHEHTSDTHRCPQTSSRMLRQLFDGRMIYKPRQQRETQGADGNFHIYALTKRGVDHLKQEGLWVDALRPTGQWVHQYMVASITASMHILSEREGYEFIPGHQITDSLAVDISFKWNGRNHECVLVPDSLFAIQYGKGYIAYLLEADRNTEPNDPKTPYRKSARRNIKQYASFIGHKIYKQNYGLNCPLIVLNITVSDEHIKRIMPIIKEETGACNFLAYGTAPMFRSPFKPPTDLLTNIFREPLMRQGREPFTIKR